MPRNMTVDGPRVPRCLTRIAGLGCAGALGCAGGSVDTLFDSTGPEWVESGTGDVSPGEEGGSTGVEEAPAPQLPTVPPPGGVRRLLAPQYVQTVRMLLGEAAAAAADPPQDPEVGNYDAMATLVSAPAPADVERYEGSAAAIAEATVGDLGVLAETVACVVDGPLDAGCYVNVAEDFGGLAWRRPVSAAESQRMVDIAVAAQEWDDGAFLTGLQYLLTAVLQSPNFLYITELGQASQDGARTLDGYEVATRASLFLTGRGPDQAALERAARGDLDTEQGVRNFARDLLARPEARLAVQTFFGEFLTVRDLASKSKDSELFGDYDEQLQASMLEETMRLVDDVAFSRESSVLELFDAGYTFVDAELANLYGVDGPDEGWAQVTLPAAQQRAGVLSHAGWLAMMSHTNVNSPTRRGLFVMEKLLCTDIPTPPARVETDPVVPADGQTLREALSQYVADQPCASCHGLTDPPGFAFEHYDAVGAYRTLDNGQPVDAAAEAVGLGAFDGAAELASLLAADARLPGCLVENVFTQGLGFVPDAGQQPALESVTQAFGEQGHRIQDLLVELVASPVFRQVEPPK